MMQFEVNRARDWFERGLPLIEKVDRELAIDIELFSRGGQEILNAIERQEFKVLGRRPVDFESRASWRWWPAPHWESCYERRRATRSHTFLADRFATGGCLFGLPQHHADSRQELLLRLPGAAAKPNGRRCARSMHSCGDATTLPTMLSLPVRERRRNLMHGWMRFIAPNAGQPTDDPVLLALTDAQRRYKIPLELLDQLAYGTAMDVAGERCLARIATSPGDLERRSTARLTISINIVTAWLLSSDWFAFASSDISDPAAEPLAERLGLAFQLTNIIRDVKEDAAMGRVYLPQEDLAKFGISPSALHSATDACEFSRPAGV